MRTALTPKMFAQRYAKVFDGDDEWKRLSVEAGMTFEWEPKSTYVKNPPYFTDMASSASRH